MSERRAAALPPLTGGTLFEVALSWYRYPRVGRWTRHLDGKLREDEYGYRLARGPQVLGWLGPTLYVAEACPEHPPIEAEYATVTCRMRRVARLGRWNEQTARLFAADCAEAALLGERASGREPDERSWAAVEEARRFATGEGSQADLDAAWDGALDAADSAAWAAGRDIAWDIGLAVAGALAGNAGRAAAGPAAWAALAAALAARRTAKRTINLGLTAARAAAGAAARAAEAAAWDAARGAQYERLCLLLTGADLPPVEPLQGGGDVRG